MLWAAGGSIGAFGRGAGGEFGGVLEFGFVFGFFVLLSVDFGLFLFVGGVIFTLDRYQYES